MAKHSDYALFSLDAYQNPTDNIVLPLGWQTYRTSDSFALSTNGYFGIAYINENTTPKQLIIAHRGTEVLDSSDIYSDLQLALGQAPTQFTDNAQPFIQAVKQTLGSQITNYDISFTGHSLGAVLAELSGVQEDKPARVFDSPGTKEIILDMIDEGKLPASALSTGQNRVIAYNSAPNLVNTANQNIGKIFRLYPPFTPTAIGQATSPASYSAFSLANQHKMGGILAQFNHDTGLPIVYSEPTTWPYGTFVSTSGYNGFFLNYDDNTAYWEQYMRDTWDNNRFLIQSNHANFEAYRIAFIADLNHTPNASQQPGVFINGDDSGNTIFGTTAKQDTVVSGIGDDIVYDFGGDDVYTDTGGTNQYHFIHSLFGNDTITDPGTFRVFIDGFEFKGYAIQPRGEMVTRYSATHKNGQVYEIEHVGIDLTIRPSGETRYIKLTNFRPHQLSVGLGEQTMQSFISIPSDDVPWDGYVNQLNCLEKGPVYVTAPSGTANGRIVGSPQNDILSVGTGGRATSAFDRIELWGCGGKDKLYANDNNKPLSAVA